MNTPVLIGVLAGGVAGFLAGWFLSPENFNSAPVSSKRIVQLEGELKVKSREVEQLTKSAAKNAATAIATPPDTPAFDSNSPEVVKRQERMKKQFQDKQKLKLDERISVLRARLGLNDKQAEAIRDLLEKNPGSPQSMIMQAMSGGKVDEAGMLLAMLRPGEKTAELTGKISELLTPEQQQAYTAFRQEQRTNEVEVKANKELARLQSSLTLSQEQKDKAFSLLSDFANVEYDNPVSPMASLMAQQIKSQPDSPQLKELEPHMGEIQAAADLAGQRRQQRVESMRDILSPEQFSLYEDQQKQGNMAEFMEGAFEDMPGNFMMGAGEEVTPETPPPPPSPTVKQVR